MNYFLFRTITTVIYIPYQVIRLAYAFLSWMPLISLSRFPTWPEICVFLLWHDKVKEQIVLAQMKLETSNFTSGVWNKYNNPAGMKYRRIGVKPNYTYLPYPRGIGNSPEGGADGGGFTIYKSQLDGIYSYYQMSKEYLSGLDGTLQKFSDDAKTGYTQSQLEYNCLVYATILKNYHYFTASTIDYASTLYDKARDYNASRFWIYAVFVLTFWVWYSAFKIVRFILEAFGVVKKTVRKTLLERLGIVSREKTGQALVRSED